MLLANHFGNRENNFNLIRLVAAFLVIVSHSYVLVLGKSAEDPFYDLTGISLGVIAVDVFFITSGFLVTASLLHRKSLVSFCVNRFLRIFPALFVALLFTVVLVGSIFSNLSAVSYFGDTHTYYYFIKNLFLIFGVEHTLPGVFESLPYPSAINGSLWTLPWEVRMYFILFLLGLFIYVLGLLNEKLMVIIFFLVSFGSLTAYNSISFFDLQVNYFIDKFARLGGYFFIGAFLYVARGKIVINKQLAFFILGLLLVSLINSDIFLLVYSFTLDYLILSLAYLL